MTPQTQSPPAAGRTAAVGAATVAVPTGAAVAGQAGAGVVAAGTPVAAGAIVAGLVTFLVQLRQMHLAWMRHNLGAYGQPDDIAKAIEQEMRYETAFAQASADRLSSALPQALAIADPVARAARVRQLLADEQRYAQQRSQAMIARAIAAVTRSVLRRESPLGAFWRLGLAKDHTEGCLRMHNRFWPWSVLERVHPPRHHGCTSSLHGFGEAIRAGWMSPGDVPDERAALRAAAGVMMEGESDRLIAELDLRDRLVEAGVDPGRLAMICLEGVGDGAAASVPISA